MHPSGSIACVWRFQVGTTRSWSSRLVFARGHGVSEIERPRRLSTFTNSYGVVRWPCSPKINGSKPLRIQSNSPLRLGGRCPSVGARELGFMRIGTTEIVRRCLSTQGEGEPGTSARLQETQPPPPKEPQHKSETVTPSPSLPIRKEKQLGLLSRLLPPSLRPEIGRAHV